MSAESPLLRFDVEGGHGAVGSAAAEVAAPQQVHWAIALASKPAFAAIATLLTVGAVAGAVVGTLPAAPSPASSTGPEQVLLSAARVPLDWGSNAAGGVAMAVTWAVPYGEMFEGTPARAVSPSTPYSNTGVPASSPRVRWGFSATSLPFSAPADVATYAYATSTSNYSSQLLFNATLGCGTPAASSSSSSSSSPCQEGSAILPGAAFFYSVGDDANGFSPVFATSSLPPAGTWGARFAVIGDLGTTNNSLDTLNHIVANHAISPFAAVFHAGDLSYADGTQTVWGSFARLISPLASAVPFSFLGGNHEWFDFADYSFTSYLARFRTPTNRPNDANSLYYSLDAGLVHFVALQTYCPQMTNISTQPCLAPGTEQLAWLVADLAAVNRALTPWVVVSFHQPWVSSNLAHLPSVEGFPVMDAIEDVLYAAKVDLVLSGHVHALERSCRTYKYACVADAPVFITIGDGGNREGLASSWTPVQPAWSVFRQATYGHGEFTAVNTTHLHWAWHQNPDLAPVIADEVWLVKGEAGEVGPGRTGETVFVDGRL